MVVFIQQAFDGCVPLLDAARGIHETYALRHGMEYVPFYGYVDAAPFGLNSMAQAHLRNMLKKFPDGTIFLHIDADALIRTQKNIVDVLQDGKDLALIGSNWVNSGVVLARKTNRLVEFLDRIFDLGPVHNENQIDVRLYREVKNYDGFQPLGDEWNWFDSYMHSKRDVSCAEDQALIRHWAGVEKREALHLMSRNIEELGKVAA